MEMFNDTLNVSSNGGIDVSEESFLLLGLIRNICLPLIASFGFLGNTVSILVFSTRGMRSSSCSVFLGALAVVDNLFLLSLVISWIDGQFYRILTTQSICTALVFVTYITSFLSVWFIVGFTCERFFAICFPLRGNFICSVFREKLVVVLMIFTAMALYSFSFWTTELTFFDGRPHCAPKQNYIGFLNIVTWADTLLTMVIPFLIISTMNTKVVCSIMHNFPITPSKTKSPAKNQKECKRLRSMRGRRCPTLRVTRTVLLVSTTFLFLNLPSHVIRLYTLILHLDEPKPMMEISSEFVVAQGIAQILYYSTFSCNFILYTLFGRNFKHSLLTMLRCTSSQETHRRRMLIRLSSTQGNSQGTSL